ncbi:hypothetical protein Efla_003994 [Eimeria flavescens]
MEATASENAPMRTAAYPIETYWGRLSSFVRQMSLRMLWASEKELQEVKRLAALADAGDWKALRAEGVTEKKLQEAFLMRDGCINPSTGEPVPPYLRLAAVAPLNVPICAGLLLTAPTVLNSVFWQWINQTYSAAFNYAQGNHPQTEKEKAEQRANLIKGYRQAVAVVVSVGLAVGLNTWLRRLKANPVVLKILQGTVPFTAVAGANVANIYCMRGHECINGIQVFTEGGQPLGISKRAGVEAVKQTAISRVVIPLPILLLPKPIISFFNVALPVTRSNAFVKVLTEMSVIYGCVNVGLPLGVAVFPSSGSLPVSQLEPEFEGLKDENGSPVTRVVFNKGI